MSQDIFAPSGGLVLSLTTTAQRVALDLPQQASGDAGENVIIYNAGTVAVAYCFGSVTALATVPDGTMDATANVIAPGAVMTLRRDRQPYLSALTLSSTATLYVSVGAGE